MEGTPRSRGASEHPNSPAQTPPESRVREVATFRGASGVVGPMLPGAGFSPTRCRFEPQTLPPTLREPACGVGGPGGASGPRAAPGKSEIRSRPRDPCRPPPPGLLAARCSHVPRAPSLALGTATGGSRCRGQTRLAFAPFPDEPAHRGDAGQSVSEGMAGTDGPGRRPPARAQGAGGCAPRGRARL